MQKANSEFKQLIKAMMGERFEGLNPNRVRRYRQGRLSYKKLVGKTAK